MPRRRKLDLLNTQLCRLLPDSEVLLHPGRERASVGSGEGLVCVDIRGRTIIIQYTFAAPIGILGMNENTEA